MENEPNEIRYFRMINERDAAIKRVRKLAWDIREEFCNDTLGQDLAYHIANRIERALEGKTNDE